MDALAWGSLGVGVAFFCHLALWRLRVPRRQTRALLLVFGGTMALLLAGLAWLAPAPPSLAELFRIGLFGLAMTLGYVITYSAVEADSPSLVIVLAIDRAGPAGLPEARLRAALDDRVLLHPRLADLARDGLAEEVGGRWRMTRKGRSFFAPFAWFRRALGAGRGG